MHLEETNTVVEKSEDDKEILINHFAMTSNDVIEEKEKHVVVEEKEKGSDILENRKNDSDIIGKLKEESDVFDEISKPWHLPSLFFIVGQKRLLTSL